MTLRSYHVDLNQAFSLAKVGKFINCDVLDKKTEFELTEPTPSFEIWSETELWSQTQKAFSRWSKLKASSRNRKHSSVKSFLHWMFVEGYLSSNLSDLISCPSKGRKLPNFISVDEVLTLISFFENRITQTITVEEKNKYLIEYVLFLLLYGGGLRVSEASKLQWQNINFSSRQILILGKGNKERIVVLPNKCLRVLAELPRNGPFVFGPKPLNCRAAYAIIRSLGTMCGLTAHLHPHALRHSYATHLLASGADLRVLQILLGHENLVATEKYTHLNIDQLSRTLEKCHPLAKR